MLPAKFRLKDKREFERVYRLGKCVSNNVFVAKFLEAEANVPKVGFSVGVRYSKKASERNRIKRLMRESIRPVIERIKKNHEIILLINSKFQHKQIDFDEARKGIEDLLRKAKLFK